MANKVEILIEAVDKASSKMGTIGQSFQKLTGFSLSAAGALAIAGVAVKKLADFAMDSIKAFEDYADQVEKMARATGASIEQTSRLIQVADDVQISYSTLSTAMRNALREGLDPSIEGLQGLADQYNSLKDPVERSQFLLQNFGKSGLDMGKLLEQGSEGIKKMGAAVSDSLILSEAAIKKAQVMRLATDGAADSWQGFKLQVGQALAPLQMLFTGLRNGDEQMIKYAADLSILDWKLKEKKISEEEYAKAIDVLGEKYDMVLPKIDALGNAIEDSGAAAVIAKSQIEFLGELDLSGIENAAQRLKDQLELMAIDGGLFVQLWADIQTAVNAGLDPTLAKGAIDDLLQYIDILKVKTEELTLKEFNEKWGTAYDTAAALDALMRNMPTDIESTIHITEYRDIIIKYFVDRGEERPNAFGGSWGTIPSYAGYEGSYIGGGHTAGARETVTVTPAYEKMPAEISDLSMNKFAGIIKKAMKEVVGSMN